MNIEKRNLVYAIKGIIRNSGMSVEVASRTKILYGWLDLETAAIEMSLGRGKQKGNF